MVALNKADRTTLSTLAEYAFLYLLVYIRMKSYADDAVHMRSTSNK
jgi:hypothetical protein